ncbi:uncharacterized protein LOC123503132 [Portunus trituberculatus]|uniref:uncharacterized protein LOC123503132 n=1 Tax=Portunus trituberculatus TaxID=210409 RepID=UPI001E1D1842|nr:uncharacterized protein LOC123503132 [Portunus trituberculatus]
MPVYKGVLSLEDQGPDTPTVHLFDYSSDGGTNTKSNCRKQLITLESCIYLGRRNLASINSQSRTKNTKPGSQSTSGIEKNTENSTNRSTGEGDRIGGRSEGWRSKWEGNEGEEGLSEGGAGVSRIHSQVSERSLRLRHEGLGHWPAALCGPPGGAP